MLGYFLLPAKADLLPTDEGSSARSDPPGYELGFLNTQRSAMKLCIHIHADIPHRSAVSDF